MEDRLALLLVAGAVLLVALIIYIAVRAESSKRGNFRDAVRSLGFIAAEPSPRLVQGLTALYRPPIEGQKSPKTKYKVEHVFSRRSGDAEMFIFDLTESDSDHGQTESRAVAVVSDRMKLPPFIVMPRVGGEGTFAKLANRAMSWAAKKMGEELDFPGHPEFQQHYMVRSLDPAATRRFLGNRLDRLTGLGHVCVRARDDVFTLSELGVGARNAEKKPLRERVDQASTIFSIFSS